MKKFVIFESTMIREGKFSDLTSRLIRGIFSGKIKKIATDDTNGKNVAQAVKDMADAVNSVEKELQRNPEMAEELEKIMAKKNL